MLKKNKVTTEYITVKILEKTLDRRFDKQNKLFEKRLEAQAKTILEAVDFSLSKHRKETDAQFDDLTKELYAVRTELKSAIKKVTEELYRVRDDLKTDINDTQTTIDVYVKSQEDSKQEFVIVKAEVGQMKQVFKQKLGVEIRAF